MDIKELIKNNIWQENKLSDSNITRILEAFVARKDDVHFARLVENGKIAENDYNISVSSYVEQPDTREKVDIEALNRRIAEIVARQNVLRTAIDAIIASL